jgi:hypothetical protein
MASVVRLVFASINTQHPSARSKRLPELIVRSDRLSDHVAILGSITNTHQWIWEELDVEGSGQGAWPDHVAGAREL